MANLWEKLNLSDYENHMSLDTVFDRTLDLGCGYALTSVLIAFDAIVSVDSYHYFGCKEGIFAERFSPL